VGVACARSDDGAEASSADVVEGESLVIRQVYADRGQPLSKFQVSFVELFNRGSKDVGLKGKHLEVTVRNNVVRGESISVPLESHTLAPGARWLVAFAEPNPIAEPFAADQTEHEQSITATDGFVALEQDAEGCDGGGACTTKVLDVVTFGAPEKPFRMLEGKGVAKLSPTTAAIRKNGGCTDTNDNAADFTVAEPSTSLPTTACADRVAADAGTGTDAASIPATDASANDAAPPTTAADAAAPVTPAPVTDASAPVPTKSDAGSTSKDNKKTGSVATPAEPEEEEETTTTPPITPGKKSGAKPKSTPVDPGGCSAAHGPSSPTGSMVPLGAALALVALRRRRRG
jgi:uncharacterized protein (TIGR03382 family)